MSIVRRHTGPTRSARDLSRWGVLLVLALLILFGWLRYDNFLSSFNILTFLGSNAMYALIALGMCFVILTGGIDLSVGGVAVIASIVAASASTYGMATGLAAGVAAGAAAGLLNGVIITRLGIAPFIATLATMLAAYGGALLLSNNQSVSVSYDTTFILLGQSDWFPFQNLPDLGWFHLRWVGLPMPAWIALVAYIVGWIVLEHTATGRRLLAVGGGEDAARLMGLEVDRLKLGVYMLSGTLAGLAGVILAAQTGTGSPTEGIGWELIAISSVVVGGTLLSGGVGSIGSTLAGAILLALLFNLINFENGKGLISLSSAWQSVIRGLFLFVFIIIQAKLSQQKTT